MMRALAIYRGYVAGRFWPLFLVSMMGWLGLLLLDATIDIPVLCMSGANALSDMSSVLAATLSINGTATFVLSSLLMIAAMMVPLLVAPMMHVRERSLAERRMRAVALFLLGYSLAWLPALCLLQIAALALRIASGSETVALVLALGLALCWQRAAWRASLLRQCHARRALPAFGLAADLGSFRFGLAIAFPCIGACGALMLLPLASPTAHLPVMGAVSVFLLLERYG